MDSITQQTDKYLKDIDDTELAYQQALQDLRAAYFMKCSEFKSDMVRIFSSHGFQIEDAHLNELMKGFME